MLADTCCVVKSVVRQEGRRVGLVGEVHPEVLERFAINIPVALFEIELC